MFGYWSGEGKCSYYYIVLVNSLYVLYEVLLMLKNEGLEKVWFCYCDMYEKLK